MQVSRSLVPPTRRILLCTTLRDLSVEDFLIPDALREEVFCQLGEKVVSRKMDFNIGYFSFKHNAKNNDQDAKDAYEMLKKA